MPLYNARKLDREESHKLTGKESFTRIDDLKKKESELQESGYRFVHSKNKKKIKPVKGNFHGLSWGLDEDQQLVYYYTPSKTVFETYYYLPHNRY